MGEWIEDYSVFIRELDVIVFTSHMDNVLSIYQNFFSGVNILIWRRQEDLAQKQEALVAAMQKQGIQLNRDGIGSRSSTSRSRSSGSLKKKTDKTEGKSKSKTKNHKGDIWKKWWILNIQYHDCVHVHYFVHAFIPVHVSKQLQKINWYLIIIGRYNWSTW